MQPEEFANKLVASMPDALVFSDEAGGCLRVDQLAHTFYVFGFDAGDERPD